MINCFIEKIMKQTSGQDGGIGRYTLSPCITKKKKKKGKQHI